MIKGKRGKRYHKHLVKITTRDQEKGDNNATKMSDKPLDQFMATAFPPVSQSVERRRRRRILIDFKPEDYGEQVE